MCCFITNDTIGTGYFLCRLIRARVSVATKLLPSTVKKSYTAKLGTVFALVVVATVAFGGVVYLEINAALAEQQADQVYNVAVSGMLGLVVLTVINLGLVAATVGGNTASSLSVLSKKATKMGEGDLDVRRNEGFAS